MQNECNRNTFRVIRDTFFVEEGDLLSCVINTFLVSVRFNARVIWKNQA